MFFKTNCCCVIGFPTFSTSMILGGSVITRTGPKNQKLSKKLWLLSWSICQFRAFFLPLSPSLPSCLLKRPVARLGQHITPRLAASKRWKKTGVSCLKPWWGYRYMGKISLQSTSHDGSMGRTVYLPTWMVEFLW